MRFLPSRVFALYSAPRRTSVNIIDKTEATALARATDLERFRLRSFVATLPPEELETRERPIDLAAVAEALDGNARAVHFRAAGPERQELIGNVTGSRRRIAH